MFGNHPLPNIVPSHSFHSPPPSPTHPPPPPPSCAPVTAHLGQAGAAHRRAPRTCVTTNNRRHVTMHTRLHRPRRPLDATSPPSTPPYAMLPPPTNSNRHVTTSNDRARHVTIPNDPQTHPQPPRQRRRTTPPRHKGCPSPP